MQQSAYTISSMHNLYKLVPTHTKQKIRAILQEYVQHYVQRRLVSTDEQN